MAALWWVSTLTFPRALALWPFVIFGLGLLYHKWFVGLLPTLLLEVLTSELRDFSQIVKVSGPSWCCSVVGL